MKLQIMLAVSYLMFGSACLAGDGQDSEAEKSSGGKWSVGLFTAAGDTEYKGDDTRAIVLPFVSYISDRFYFSGLETGYAVLGDKELSLFAILSARLDYYQEDDSYIFQGMGDHNPSMDAGLKLRYNNDIYTLECGAKADMLGVSNGYELFADISKEYNGIFGFEKLNFEMAGGLEWRNDDLNDYYYGVEQKYATATREQYDADGGLNYNVGVKFSYHLDEHWTIFNGYQANFLSGEISDSPLVDKDVVVTGALGLIYSF